MGDCLAVLANDDYHDVIHARHRGLRAGFILYFVEKSLLVEASQLGVAASEGRNSVNGRGGS